MGRPDAKPDICMDTFSHRISYLLEAGLPLDDVYDKYIEDRYKRTMLGLPRERREEVCAHPDKYYPDFSRKWDADWQRKVSEVEKLLKRQHLESIMVRTLLRARLKGTGIQFRITHQEERVKVVYSMPKKKEVAFTLRAPDREMIDAITRQVIEAQKGGPLSPSAKVGPRSIYGVWESGE